MNKKRESEKQYKASLNNAQNNNFKSKSHLSNPDHCQINPEIAGIVLDCAGDAIFLTCSSGAIIYANAQMSNLLGYSRAELMRMVVHDIDLEFPKEDWPCRFERLKKGKFLTIESRYSCKDGSVIPVEITGNYVKLKKQEFNCVAFRNISSRKRLEEELYKSKQKYQAIFEYAADGICLIDVESGLFINCNPAYERLTGRTLEELKKMHVWEIRPHDQIEKAKQKTFEIEEKGMGGSRELAIQRPDGEIVKVEFTAAKIKIGDEEYFLGISRDINEQKKLEEALKEYRDSLEEMVDKQTERLNEKNRELELTIASCNKIGKKFRDLTKSYVHAHEEERQWIALEVHDRIVQNLIGINKNLEYLSNEVPDHQKAQGIIKDTFSLCQSTISEARNIMGELYPATLSRYGLTRLIYKELDELAKYKNCRSKLIIDFKHRLDKKLETTLYRICHEALLNIRKHSDGISIILLSLHLKGSNVILELSDNGSGFNTNILKKDLAAGGLESMRRRAEVLGGTFNIESSKGKGTMIKVSLPIENF